MLSLVIFSSSFLLFQVQPLIGKYILPWFGGGAGVWAVCMLFFQVLLLGGYAYAHASIRWLRPRAQVIVHGVILAGALALLPITPSERWRPEGAADPTWRILLLLVVTLGLPYFALSATAPLVQGWFARLNPGRSPYRLYALSNVASLLALLAYPFVVEPALTRSAQAVAWSCAFGAYAVLYAGCAGLLFWQGDWGREEGKGGDGSQVERPKAGQLALWVMLPAAGSAMLLGATNKICQDLAAAPFLWVVPLGLYLVTFIVGFDSPQWYSRLMWVVVLLVVSGVLVWVEIDEIKSVRLSIGCYGGVMLACCMLCHGELAKLKPDPAYLTRYYLCIAGGGALGGAGVAILAPLVFSGYYEFHTAAMVSCGLSVAIPFARQGESVRRVAERLALYGTIPPVVFLAVLLAMEIANWPVTVTKIVQVRSFHGALTVSEKDEDEALRHVRLLRHGATTHGAQHLHPSLRDKPTGYYAANAGPGCVLRSLRPEEPRRIGVVGLGVGTIATYGKKGDVIRFYEIDAEVERLARKYFTYLGNSAAKVEVVLGDARLSLEREEAQRFDVIFVDAFSGDAIPTHLITREALGVYLRHLVNDGAIVFHVSNNYLNLVPVLANLAEQAGMQGSLLWPYGRGDMVEDYPSEWVILTRNRGLLESEKIKSAGRALRGDARVGLWTDDHASLLRVLR